VFHDSDFFKSGNRVFAEPWIEKRIIISNIFKETKWVKVIREHDAAKSGEALKEKVVQRKERQKKLQRNNVTVLSILPS